MSPLSTREGQEKFLTQYEEDRKAFIAFERRALWAVAVSYIILFLFLIGGAAYYFNQKDQLREASCTGRLTVQNLLIFADQRAAQQAAQQPPSPELTRQLEAAHDFYRAALENIDVSDCDGIHLKPPLSPVSAGGGSTP